MEKVLLEDILYDEKYAEDYARITEQLFENHKQFMMLPRLILEIKRSGDKAYEILFDDLVKNIRTVREFVRDLDSVYGEKYIVLKCYSEIPDYPIMDHIPEGLLNVLTAAEPIECNDPENICQMIRHLYAIFKSEEEEKKALDAALKYALICDQHYPNIVAVHNMLTCGVLPRGAVCRCIYHTLEKKGGIPTTLYTMPMAKDEFAKQVYDEFCEALQTLPTMKDRFSEEVISKGQAVLRGMIKLTQENFQRMKISY